MRKKILFITLVILVVGSFLAFWLYRNQIFSKEVLYFELQGPASADIGEEITYTIKYKNQGSFLLEDPLIVFQFPDNAVTADGKTRVTKNLDDLSPGAEQYLTFKARLMGRENDLQVARASLSYTPKNLSARYESDTTFTTKIETVPIALTYDISSTIEQDAQITYDINYFSNVDYELKNVSIKVDSIEGFTIKSSKPASLDKAEWKLGTLEKGKGGRITITGTVEPTARPPLEFTAHLGVWNGGRFVALKDANQQVEIAQPLAQLMLSQSAMAASDTPGGYTVEWKVKNDLANAKNVKVKAVLPPGATINDYIVPEDQAAKFSFDTKSREIVWVVGDLAAEAQVQISFQIMPLLGTVGANLLGAATISGEDQVTGEVVQAVAGGLTIP